METFGKTFDVCNIMSQIQCQKFDLYSSAIVYFDSSDISVCFVFFLFCFFDLLYSFAITCSTANLWKLPIVTNFCHKNLSENFLYDTLAEYMGKYVTCVKLVFRFRQMFVFIFKLQNC